MNAAGDTARAAAWKALNERRSTNGGYAEWHRPHGRNRPGKWMPKITDLEPCVRGYHVCDNHTDMLSWLGPDIWVCEWRGLSVRSSSKRVVEQARLIRHADRWNEQSARLFAADCAEHVLPLWEAHSDDDRPRRAIAAARAHARGEIGLEELDAAGAAARDAARDAAGAAAGAAARAAARAAAWAATRAATRDGAWAAAKDAAKNATRAAARAAARDAARAAAGNAAGNATWGAAWAATRDTARDAERVWQAEQLRDLIGDL